VGRTLIAFAAWFAVAMSPAVAWVVTGHALPPWWLTAAVGLAVFAAVEVGGRVRARGRLAAWGVRRRGVRRTTPRGRA
jgi:hypothetical protein